MVELSEVIGGPVINSYAVQDKVQEAELDPNMIIEDELVAVEAWEPCLICDTTDNSHATMYCDGCDNPVHVFCAGYDETPEVYYCEVCLADLENETGLPGLSTAVRRQPRRRAPTTTRQARRNNDRAWARVWQAVSRRLDLDLDFPYDEEITDQRTEEQQREFVRWQRRFEVANSQGASNRLREIANARLLSSEPVVRPDPESQEELRAWNAFDKARESQEAPQSIRRRKRKASASPSPSEPQPSEQPQQKRPRLRRPPLTIEQPREAESSSAAVQRTGDEPTFLSSLLKEVETKPVLGSSPGASEYVSGQYSPRDSSSPPSSGSATPRAGSLTPPPQRPLSPPLSSTIVPLSSPIGLTFSPFSPADLSKDAPRLNGNHDRGRRRSADSHRSEEDKPRDRASSASPSRNLSYSAKEEIQRMVKLALGARYRNEEITKDQYTDINRDVSRKLYELVGSAAALADQAAREKWQGVADEEVKQAIALLSPLTLCDE